LLILPLKTEIFVFKLSKPLLDLFWRYELVNLVLDLFSARYVKKLYSRKRREILMEEADLGG